MSIAMVKKYGVIGIYNTDDLSRLRLHVRTCTTTKILTATPRMII